MISTMFGRIFMALCLSMLLTTAHRLQATESAAANRATSETTRQTILGYFDQLKRKGEWETSLAEGMLFTSFTSPVKEVKGRDEYLRSTVRFYSMITSLEVRELIVDGDRACALTRYQLQPPNAGAAFMSDVAEIFTVRNGKIDSLEIYFDSAPFPR